MQLQHFYTILMMFSYIALVLLEGEERRSYCPLRPIQVLNTTLCYYQVISQLHNIIGS